MAQVRTGRARPSIMLTVGVSVLAIVVVAVLLAMSYFAPVSVPNVVGMTVEEAVATLADAGINVEGLDGDGTVTDQSPVAGEQWRRGDDMVLGVVAASYGSYVVSSGDPAASPPPGMVRGPVEIAEAILDGVDRLSLGVQSCNGEPAAEVDETASTVTVTVTATPAGPGGTQALCRDSVVIPLRNPLGDRTLVDGSSGDSVQVALPEGARTDG